MTEVLKFGKKIFTASVVGTTMLWSVGVSALLPAVANAAVCPTLAAGDMIKVSGKPAIYSINKDLKVLYFPSGDEFKSWNVDNSYGGYVTVTQECFDSLPVPSSYPGAVNYRAGSYVVKRPSSDQLYVVLPGNTLSKISTTNAAALYGASYKVMTVADAFWPHYVNRGADNAGAVHEGMLVKKDSKNWYVAAGNVLREVTATGMTANGFKSAFVRTVSASALAATTVGTQLAAEESVLKNRTQDGTIVAPVPGPAPVVGGNLTVSLASDNPAAANLADGSAYNSLLKLTLGASSATQVTGLTLTKTGLIANSNISGVSVWDSQGNRHGDVMTSLTSDNKVTVSFGANPVLVAAGGSESLTVKVNISAGANSGLVGFSVAAATDVSSNGTVGGSFPVAGNQMSIIDGNASLAGVSTTLQSQGGAAASGTGNLNVGDKDKEVSKLRVTETSGNEDISVSKLTFYFEGTVQDADLTNFSVYAPDGTKLGSAQALVNRYVTINLTPYTVPKSTNRDLVLKVDVVNGSGRWFNVHLQNDYDVMIKGASTGFYVLPTGFTDTRGGTAYFQMNAGTLTVNKNSASPAGNISAGAQGIVLAKFDVKAVGENMELRKMGLGVNKGNGSLTNLTGNVVVRDAADGTVYLTVAASTASLYTPTAAQNNLSNYISLTAGQTKSLEVVGSVGSTATSGVSYTVGIGNFYAKRASSLDFADNLPNATNTSTAANQLTVSATSLTCNKDTSMGSVTRAPGAITVIGQYICTAGTSEDVRMSNATVAFGLASGMATNMFQNMSLWQGSTQLGSTISTVASSSNSYNFDLTVPKSGTVTLQVKALVVSGSSGVVTSGLSAFSYNGKDSGTAGTGVPVATGQQVTVGAGNVNITFVSDATTISKIYGPAQTGVQLGKWKFAAANDAVTLNKLTLQTVRQAGVGGGVQTALGTFGTLSLYDGATKLADASYVAGDVVFTGFSSSISMDSYKIYTLKGTTNGSGVITNNTTTAFVVKSDSNTDMEARSAAGALLGTADINYNSASNAGTAESRLATSTAYIFHDAYPTIAAVSLGTALDLDTKAKVLKFIVTNSGTRDLRVGSTTVSFSVSGLQSSGVVTAASGTIRDFRLYEDNGSGGLGTWLAGGASGNADIAIGTTTANPSTINFNGDDDQSDLLANFIVSPGASRTLIVTADTSNMGSAKTAGTSVTLSAKIAGTTGWSGTAWNTGNLFYFYTPVGGEENAVPGFSASDSYDVQGSTMSKTF